MHRFSATLWLSVFLVSSSASGQTGDGSLRGYVRDETGGVLPGVTVTAVSPVLIGTRSDVTNDEGYYRLVNLPPGSYVLTAELPGFQTYRREGILVRAGATFSLDVQMGLSSVEETVTVTGESPMIEVANPTHALNIDGDFQREIPVQARRNWSDFLELTTGVLARPFDDNSGRLLYFGHATDLWANVMQIEGNNVANYNDGQTTNVNMSTDLISDIDVKIGGVPASEPMGTGLVINIVTKSGGDEFSGGAGYTLQPLRWSSDNTGGVGTPTQIGVNQIDASFGGPIRQQKAWFFFAHRYADLETGVSRTPLQTDTYRALFPGWAPFNSESKSHQPYLKLTGQVSQNHQVNGYWQRDRVEGGFFRSIYYEPTIIFATGGDLFGGKLTSVWGSQTTTQFTFTYNNKSGADEGTLSSLPGSGPELDWHRDVFLSSGRVVGTGSYGTGGNTQSVSLRPASMLIFRGDLTYYKEGWGGSHEFQTGIYAAPRLRYDVTTSYVNGGFVYEERRLLNPDTFPQVPLTDPLAQTVPFHQRYVTPTAIQSLAARDRDIGFYVQDFWKPHRRVTLSLGLRTDFVRRFDDLFGVTRMDSVELGPRAGFTYLVTEDSRNVLRASFSRVHEAVNGRDRVSSLSAGGGRVQTRDIYDLDGDGVFEREFVTPMLAGQLAGHEFDSENLHQPFTDEYIVGFRRQFAGQMAVDVAGVHRRVSDIYALVDVNGIYPDGPGQPFIGFGRIDPTRGILYQQTNNEWDKLVYSAIEITATKNLANRYQLLVGIHRQWQHMSGTWNPTDPARFIQPEAYPNNRQIFMPRGNYDHNNYEGNGLGGAYGPSWRKYSIRTAVTWFAPHGIVAAANWNLVAGPWSGYLLTRTTATDPDVLRFGPASVPVQGGVQSNPLATTVRFKFPTRGDGQEQLPDVPILNLKVGKKFQVGSYGELEVAANILNVFNNDEHWSYNYYGGNRDYNPSYLEPFIRANARGVNMFLGYRF